MHNTGTTLQKLEICIVYNGSMIWLISFNRIGILDQELLLQNIWEDHRVEGDFIWALQLITVKIQIYRIKDAKVSLYIS